jgi:glycosyltransferase involved in cell wall biosynthesis
VSRHHEAAVIVPAFDGEDTIAAALASAAASISTSGRDAVISVVDDASTDSTVAVVREFTAGSPIPVVLGANPVNVGTGGTRNRAIDQVSAAAYLFLDQDDEYLPDHVGHCLGELAAAPQVGFVKTSVVLDDPVHPEWREAIAQSLVQTLCVRARCHRLVGGFLDHPAVATYGCDDVLYNRLLTAFFPGVRSERATVRFRRRPGGSFDRQYERKFTRPPQLAEVTLSPEQQAVAPVVAKLFEERRQEVARRVRGFREPDRARPV